jgi:hypothetical protein
MQKHFSVFMKLMVTVLLFGVASFAKAATVTYSLTTKVDGRTITATANLNAGDNLNDNMPQDLWRGYTTYKYYSDAALTQEITEAPADGGTVYVDYEFDPPFQMSNDNKTVWNYLRNYNGGGSTNRYVYYNKSRNRIDSQDNTSVNSNKKIQWAFYGDGYSFNIKVNDSSISNPWLVWSTTATGNIINGYYYYLTLGAKPEVGWQIYANAATNFKRPGGTVSFGRPDNKDLAYLDDGGLDMRTEAIKTDQHHFDSHNQLVANHTGSSSQATIERNALWWYAFFASPVTSYPNTQDIWHVTYKILGADGTWYDDIVIQKSSSNLTPTWPVPDFNPKEGYDYEYFYSDATFSEKFEGPMPNDCNTTLYIKEVKYISEPWKTLVLPFAIDDLAEYFGADYEGVPSVNVSELQDVQGTLTEAGDESFYNCKLFFNPVTKIEAYKPYLFKVNRVDEKIILEMYAAEGNDPCEVTEVADPVNAGISACMQGTLEGYDMDASDGLSFYFGYDEANDAYNFYRVSARIPKNRCWFYISDNRAAGAKLQVVFDSEVNSINTQIADKSAKGNIYNVNGQLMGTQKSNLPKGLYIVNGKKMVIK